MESLLQAPSPKADFNTALNLQWLILQASKNAPSREILDRYTHSCSNASLASRLTSVLFVAAALALNSLFMCVCVRLFIEKCAKSLQSFRVWSCWWCSAEREPFCFLVSMVKKQVWCPLLLLPRVVSLWCAVFPLFPVFPFSALLSWVHISTPMGSCVVSCASCR